MIDDKTIRFSLHGFQKRLARDKYFVPCFLVIEGDRVGEKVSISKDKMVIGRSFGCDILIEDPLISKKHAEVTLQPGNQVLIKDLESTNGLFLNNSRASEAFLKDGDLVKLGKSTLKFIGSESVENQYISELSDKARLDGLTGIYNKEVFHDYLSKVFKRCLSINEPLSLIIMDLDYFKKINDKMGHLTGDYTLKEIAILLNKTFRQTDMFARYGGEEFGVILPHTNLTEAVTVAERIRSTIGRHPMSFETFSFSVTVSIGVAELDSNMKEPNQLIAAADAALYLAKRQGRNRVITPAL